MVGCRKDGEGFATAAAVGVRRVGGAAPFGGREEDIEGGEERETEVEEGESVPVVVEG